MQLTSRGAFLALAVALAAWGGTARGAERPSYRISATVDYELLTFRTATAVRVPAAAGDPLRDVVLFVYANSGGIGGDDERRRNIVVDGVRLNGQAVPFSADGPVLRARLPQAQSAPFTLEIESRGVVSRSSGAAAGAGLGADLSGLLGGSLVSQGAKPKNPDFGLYTYGNGILSLGSFWYPQLAVRERAHWVDRVPEGLGDVAFAEMSDFDVEISAPPRVRIAATGREVAPASRAGFRRWVASGVRDFAVLMSEDFVVKSVNVELAGKSVVVESYNTPSTSAKAERALDVAAQALGIFSRRFGPYPYEYFKVVEGPIRGGAGGMEFSGLTSVSSMVYQDLGSRLGQITGLGLGDLDKLLAQLRGATGLSPGGVAGAPVEAPNLLAGIIGQPVEIFESLLEMTIAHEAAHQWWAIRVGSDSVRAPFVDESLANYSAILYFEDRYGRPAAERMMDLHVRTPYRTSRLLGMPDAAANLATSAYRGNLQYGAVVYGKGALFYDALRHAVGDAAFFAALRDYSESYAGKLAGPRSLIDIVAARAPAAKVDALYRRWIEEMHGDEDISGGAPATFDELLRKALTPD